MCSAPYLLEFIMHTSQMEEKFFFFFRDALMRDELQRRMRPPSVLTQRADGQRTFTFIITIRTEQDNFSIKDKFLLILHPFLQPVLIVFSRSCSV